MRSTNILFVAVLTLHSDAFNKQSIEECARVLSENLQDTFKRVTKSDQIIKLYSEFVEPELFDPRQELKRSKTVIENYLQRRAEFAYNAKVSLEVREVVNASDEEVNDPNSKDFIRFMSAKQGNDATTIYVHDHSLRKTKVNETRNFSLTTNANFYHLSTSSIASAVHIPTPLYDRNPELLRKIQWSEIDEVYRTQREETRDLAFQLFCSESGYMRFFPAASWFWDNHEDHLDLFDCRNTQWYINAATNSKNLLIMLDMSGSMLGQRYEIAKQTTEAILETLSHNDYFNIMPFSKTPFFLDDCNGKKGLLQATMRNKKVEFLYSFPIEKLTIISRNLFRALLPSPKDRLKQDLRNKMNNVSSEGKAEYEKALAHAFTALLDINSHGAAPDQGCENVIMLITDGAPNVYKEIFDLYNKDKKVRFFSFLIGEEAIDFEQVKTMACTNRGYMVHVQNMADVEDKVQYYIRTMSRAIGQHAADIQMDDALWSGVYRERLYLPRPEIFAEPVPITNQSYAVMNKMAARRKTRLQKTEARSRMFVTTVSFPVIVNRTFMGVAAVNIPLTELNQQAHPSNIGGRSYFFMLDQNGFVMFHPQLRPIDPRSRSHKQNYNNMDLLELEVPQTQQVRKMVLNCDNSDPQLLDVLYGTEMLDRIYPQTNTYYSECIKGANFVLGLAVAKGDEHRWRPKSRTYDYSHVQTAWMSDKQWRVHPHWRYCLLNDTDTNITKEEAFVVYAEQMRHSGKLPVLCQPREQLVNKLLVDLEATSALQDSWDQQWQFLKDNLIHLVFFTAPSGLIRFYNQTLDDYDYEDPNWNIFDHIGAMLSIEHVQELFVPKRKSVRRPNKLSSTVDKHSRESYNHFITDLNRKSVDDNYYRRSVRMRNHIVFDVSNKSKIWYKSETQLTAYGLNENLTMLAQGTKAIYLGNALLGVAGFEFAYDYFVNLMGEHGCAPSDDRRWCVLLDEHGYVFYSNQKDISYENYLEDPINKGKHISQWFGSINRVSQRAMSLLVEKRFYLKLKYTDHQATCKEKKVVVMSANTLKPLRWLYHWFVSSVYKLLLLFRQYALLHFLHSLVQPIEAYTASFHEGTDGYPCSKQSYFYLSNTDGRSRPQSTSLVDMNRSDRPCTFNSAKCSVKMQATFVEGTNLIMVWIVQDKTSDNCYDETQCPKVEPSEVPFGFEPVPPSDPSENCNGLPHRKPSRSNSMCYNGLHEVGKFPCSFASTISSSLLILFSLIVLRVL
ncbi:Voltage-dependent calcium channel unc-36 [Parelaphostrongylus tenuis]|uniref:Voltage-dependent calcium channel unc-36 n=1 Tax=Parelaphostrongylus tenuis TaxID=148309 RepID=A0AAD5QPG3_PARTN|nr:Voltage-dependent calcium channel unc-36 [Parelaphostrongylus tenuis]